MKRRTFLQLVVGIGSIGVSEVTLVRRESSESKSGLFVPKPEEVDKLAGRIRFQGLENFSDLSILEPNPESFARSLLIISSIDGGEEEKNQVIDFILDRGLEVSVINSSPTDASGKVGETFLFSGSGNPVRVELTKTTVRRYSPPTDQFNQRRADITVIHELTHVVQQARNPNLWSLCFHGSNFGTRIAVGLASESVIEEILVRRTGRRNLIVNYFLGFLFVLGAERMLPLFGNRLTPYERQADFMADRVVNSPSFDLVRDKFFQ